VNPGDLRNAWNFLQRATLTRLDCGRKPDLVKQTVIAVQSEQE
jgi:hypothetical protein